MILDSELQPGGRLVWMRPGRALPVTSQRGGFRGKSRAFPEAPLPQLQ